MKAMVLSAPHTIEIRGLPEPKIQNPRDVLLKIESVGICGSDVHYYKEGKIGDQVVKYPHTVGHECSATVLEIGEAVTRVHPGQRIALEPLISCYNCEQCNMGRYHTCLNQKFLGCPGQLNGCLSERLVMPESCCYPIPDMISFDRAALIEPLSIGLYAVELAPKLKDKSIAILGAGPIGISVMLMAGTAHPDAIYVTDKIDFRCETAKAHGADWAGNPTQCDTTSEILSMKNGLDIVFECCGRQEALNQSLDLLKPGGTLMVVGIPETDRISFNISHLRRKEITIINVRRQNECVNEAIDLVSSAAINADFMITHHFNLDQTAQAFDLVAEYRDNVIKAIVNI